MDQSLRGVQRRNGAALWRVACLAIALAGVNLQSCSVAAASPPVVREFDGWITAVDAGRGTWTVRHNPTQYRVVLRSVAATAFTRIRQAPFDAFPTGTPMRFWGGISPDRKSFTIQGIRRAAADDRLTPQVVAAQNHVAGRLRHEGGKLFVDAGATTLSATVDPMNFEGFFEEPGSRDDLAVGRAVHVRYEEKAEDEVGGVALAAIVTVALPPVERPPSPPSGATPEQVRRTFAEIAEVHRRIAPQLARLMPVTMTVSPELARRGEPVVLRMEAVTAPTALAEKPPNASLEVRCNFLAANPGPVRTLALPWRADGKRHGLTVYRAECRLPADACGSYAINWKCDVGGDIDEFRRCYSVIDDTYAVCMFLSTSHQAAGPGADFARHGIPYEEWIGGPLVLGDVLRGDPQAWAGWSREARRYPMHVNPHLFGPYWVRGAAASPMANFQAESPELQQAVLEGYRDMLPRFGIPDDRVISAYTMDNRFSQIARAAGYHAIGSLCSGQNFMDGPMRINHFGMPDRPFFISRDDFRKPGPGGRDGLVGLPQCQRNTFLNREYNCTYCLEPAWNEYYNEGGGRREVDEVSMSRMFDFFEAMLQNRLSQGTVYCFSVGLEFNGVAPGISESNRMFIDYAVRKARTKPLVFSTGPAVAEYYRRHLAETPETTCFQQDYFAGLTKLDKPAGYPDTLEIEGPEFQSLLRSPSILPAYQYDYRQPWDYPAWGNERLQRNRWGYLYPGMHDPFEVVPKIVDTRQFRAERRDSARDGRLEVRLTVEAPRDQERLVLALWELGREWRRGEGWWRVDGQRARFVAVRAPLTGDLHGLLVADVRKGVNRFLLTIDTPPRRPVRSAFRIGDQIEGRVYPRDGTWTAYLWPTRPWSAAVSLRLPPGKIADAYVAPLGRRVRLAAGENRFEIPAGRWMRVVGLPADELAPQGP